MNPRLSSFVRVGFLSVLICVSWSFVSCRKVPPSPDALALKICEQLRDYDPKATGCFFDAREMPAEDVLILTYHIARLDDQDDVWTRRRQVQFLFRPAPDDPTAPGGWYLERVGGDYLQQVSVQEGMQAHWDYDFYQTPNGTREGISRLAALKKTH